MIDGLILWLFYEHIGMLDVVKMCHLLHGLIMLP